MDIEARDNAIASRAGRITAVFALSLTSAREKSRLMDLGRVYAAISVLDKSTTSCTVDVASKTTVKDDYLLMARKQINS